MAEQQKDLAYYLNHPDELPEDVESIATLAGGDTDLGDSDDDDEELSEPVEKTEEAPAAKVAEAKSDEVKETTADVAATPVEEAPIATRDGKHTLPYSVLSTERERRQAAERVASDLHAKLEQMQQQASAGTTQTTEQQAAVSDLLADEDLAEVVKDFPAVQKLIDAVGALNAQVTDANSKLQKAQEREERRQQDELDQVRQDTQATIDGIPKLLYVQQERPELWEAAVEADNQLKVLPATKGLTMAQRFEKAVSIVETIYGEIELPAKYAPAKVSTSQQPSVADKVEAALAKVSDISKPTTLNELPGGVTPSADPLEDVAGQSAAALGSQLMNMTPDAISRLLARVG